MQNETIPSHKIRSLALSRGAKRAIFFLEQGQVLKASTGTPPPKLTVSAPPVFFASFLSGVLSFLQFSWQSTKKVLENKNYLKNLIRKLKSENYIVLQTLAFNVKCQLILLLTSASQ